MNTLPSNQLDAFTAVAKTGSFSLAARALNITQSALSQRVIKLEEELETALFLRDPSGIRVTAVGEKLLQYCHARTQMENEFLFEIGDLQSKALSGLIKIASFSTYVRSRLMPALGKFGRKHRNVRFDVSTREIRDLPKMLKSGESDYVVNIFEINKKEVSNINIGIERNVLVHSTHKDSPKNVFIDHDETDTTTYDFWKIQKKGPKTYQRLFFGEVYTIIKAVEEGFGSAVGPLHIVKGNKNLVIAKGYNPLDVPIFLSFYQQSYYTKLQQEFTAYMEPQKH